MSKNHPEIIASIDIGSTNILVLIARKDETGVHILGIGNAKSEGIKKGIVVNIQTSVTAVKEAISQAENMAGHKLSSIISGVSGIGIKSLNSSGRISIKYDMVDENDVMNVLQSAEAITLPATEEIIHTTPRTYMIDSDIEADDPIGMHGAILQAQVHVITNEKSCIKNTNQSVYQCGVRVEETIPNIIAASNAILSNDEQSLGVCMIDIGGGTTDVAIFENGSICHTSIIPLCAHEVSTDVMYAFGTTQEVAETLKKDHGYALAALIDLETLIDVEYIGDSESKKLSSRTLSEVIEARYEEIFNEVKVVLSKSGFEQKIASIVLTGGGSKIQGCTKLAENLFSKPVRIGVVKSINGAENLENSPDYSVVMGLLLTQNNIRRQGLHMPSGIWAKIGGFFNGNL